MWYDVTRTYTGAPPFVGPAFNQTTHDSDGIFGFHAGAQWQWGAWVLGVEAALSACFDECRSYTGVLPTLPSWMALAGSMARFVEASPDTMEASGCLR